MDLRIVGSDEALAIMRKAADVTADAKYHVLLDAVREGMPVAVVDHAEMERASLKELAWWLAVPGVLDTVLIEAGGLASPLRL